MEFRKLISFGKSSFVISLPKSWINSNGLKKGDTLTLSENNNEIILYPHVQEKEEDNLEIVINIDDKKIRHIKREIISAYINNYKVIILKGKSLKDHAKELQDIIQSFVALEIMEQDSNKIIAKDFLNLNDISIDSVLSKINMLIKSMFEDTSMIFKEDKSENIIHRDNDVNKLSFLMFRTIHYGVSNPGLFIKKFGYDQKKLFELWMYITELETVADCLKRIVRYLSKVKYNSTQKKEIEVLFKASFEYYDKMVKTYLNRDLKMTHELINQRNGLIDQAKKLYEIDNSLSHIAMVDRLIAIIAHTSYIGRLVYQW
jgi:phosphate uptake regulator